MNRDPRDAAARRSAGRMAPAGYATTDAGWLRQVSRALALLIVVALVVLLLRIGRDVLAEGERMALRMAEQNLENLVWLEGKRALVEEGAAGLHRRAGGDPRAWAQDRLATVPAADLPTGKLPAWAEQNWSFDAASGELRYTPAWLPGGVRRWRVELVRDGVESPSPGLARDLLLVRIDREDDAT
ncbi:MAG TPA: hypothetical protein DCM32_10095 [Xanthomonadaceae bacterium]|nr:hypothetical protein [Xanthomonadaceae bacterium]